MALVVLLEIEKVEVTLATTSETVIVFVRVAVEVMVVVEEVVVSARARRGRRVVESIVEILIVALVVDRSGQRDEV